MESLEIKTFVTDLLDQICLAVAESRDKHPDIAPKILGYGLKNEAITSIEFDIAVTVAHEKQGSESKGNEGSRFKIKIASAEAGLAGGGNQKETYGEKGTRETVSRVKFSIPTYFQYVPTKKT